MKARSLTVVRSTPQRQSHRKARRYRRRPCWPVLCPVCGGHKCDCQTVPTPVHSLSVRLPYDLPY